jgi:hypothetical protein
VSSRTRIRRALGASVVVTISVTVAGVLLGPTAAVDVGSSATPDLRPSPSSATEEPIVTEVRAPSVPLPDVPAQRHADFTRGDDLPDGAKVVNTGFNKSGLKVSGGLLVHGPAEGPGAAGFVETKLKGQVRSLGARVRFPGDDSGSVALVGWKSSLVAAHKKGGPTPATGLRLVASPGRWELSVVDDGDVKVIASGDYESGGGSATFEVRRVKDTLYVVDPTGVVTTVEDKRVLKLAGPWASWGLSETGPDQKPASIEAVWAG